MAHPPSAKTCDLRPAVGTGDAGIRDPGILLGGLKVGLSIPSGLCSHLRNSKLRQHQERMLQLLVEIGHTIEETYCSDPQS